MKKEDLKKLFENEDFLSDLYKVDSMESLQKFLAMKGVQMTMDDIDKAIKAGSHTELTEDELKNVSGGFVLKWIKFAWDCFMFNPIEVH